MIGDNYAVYLPLLDSELTIAAVLCIYQSVLDTVIMALF